MKKFLLLAALVIGCTVRAAAVYWAFDIDNPSSSFEGANAFTYVWEPSTNVASDFINSWTTDYVATGSVFGGLANQDLSLDEVEGWNIIKSSFATTLETGTLVDLVVILEQNGNYFYTVTDSTIMADTSNAPASGYPLITDSEWTEFTVGGTTPPSGGDDSGVPEPTALALLALGVAGLALKRKVA